jgi:hypothetical protein
MYHPISCLFALFSLCLAECHGFYFEDCGPNDAIIRFENISFFPDPVVFGDFVHVQAKMRFLEGIKGGYERLEVYRVIKLLGYPFTFSVGCPFGNECLNDLCTAMSRGMICEWMRGSGHDCGCPSSSTLVESQNYPVHVPPISAFVSFFADGLYRLRWTQYDYQMKEIGCVTADINFTGKKS